MVNHISSYTIFSAMFQMEEDRADGGDAPGGGVETAGGKCKRCRNCRISGLIWHLYTAAAGAAEDNIEDIDDDQYCEKVYKIRLGHLPYPVSQADTDQRPLHVTSWSRMRERWGSLVESVYRVEYIQLAATFIL